MGATMNSSSVGDSTAGGYYNSYMHQTVMPKIAAQLQNVLGTHLLSRRLYLSNGTNSSGKSNSAVWTTGYACLLNEFQIFGNSIYENEYDIGVDDYQLPLFNYEKVIINGAYNKNLAFWTRSIVTSVQYLQIMYYNSSITRDYSLGYSSNSRIVRPLIYVA